MKRYEKIALIAAGPFLIATALFFAWSFNYAAASFFVVMALSVLAAFGYARIVEGMRPTPRRVLFTAIVAALAIEYHTRATVAPFPSAPAPVYRVLAGQPPGIVAELPMPEFHRVLTSNVNRTLDEALAAALDALRAAAHIAG